MSNLKKPIGTIYKLLFALILALALVNVSSCDGLLDLAGGSQGGGQNPGQNTEPENPDDEVPEPFFPTNYRDYANFNPANYVLVNESGRPDSEIAELKDWIWLMYAENEYAGEWTANYVKTNKIKTVLSNERGYQGWMDPDYLDRFYLGMEHFSFWLGVYKKDGYLDNNYDAYLFRQDFYGTLTHETMHIVQHKSGAWIDLMKGMRPDICAAAYMLTEFLPWFYTTRYPGTDVSVDMENAVETQSKYMVLETDPDGYDAARAKDPSLPNYIHSSPWFINSLDLYAQNAFTVGLVRERALSPPLRQASKEDMLKVARALLACRDPKQAGVTDDALWTVFDTLRRAATGDSKYLQLTDNPNAPWGLYRGYLDNFQDLIADWDAWYATSINPPAITIEYSNFSSYTGEEFKTLIQDVQIAYNDNRNGCRTAIESRNMPWCIEFVDPFMSLDSVIIEGKLYIYYSCDDHYVSYYQGNRNRLMDRIGDILKTLAESAFPRSLTAVYAR